MFISIKKIDYNNKDDSRILEAVLNNWFINPKELNLVIKLQNPKVLLKKKEFKFECN